ncbi:hypothetical protein [Lysobacter claricitrinus]|uniref:hypothetical protein n=1 Tax=Lysobacter claricitrinus TaxID=3367728 RepID=UPI0037DB92F3
MTRAFAAVAALALLAACSKPAMPDKDKPVEPQSAASHDDLRRAIDDPINKAKATQSAADASAKSQDDAIEAATSGN